MLPPHHRVLEPAQRAVRTTDAASARATSPRTNTPPRPARPGRPPVMRPPLPARALALADWRAFLAVSASSEGAAS